MAKAKSVADVIAGEATSGTQAERWADMVAIASVIQNRATQLGISPQEVVANSKEFNAYGKTLPSGADEFTGLAEQAMNYVQENGPVHNATFYATPSSVDNLPSGLAAETETSGHQFFSDPQARAINTAVGYKKPNAAIPANVPTPTARPAQTDMAAMPGTTTEALPSTGLLSGYSPTQQTSLGGLLSQAQDAGSGLLGIPSIAAAKLSDAFTPSATPPMDIPNAPVENDLGLGAADLASMDYSLGPNRPNVPSSQVTDGMQMAVTMALGPDYSASMTSGTEGSLAQFGSNRHKTGLAGDFSVYDPSGRKLSLNNPADVQALKDVAQVAAANGQANIGLGYASAPGMMHVDYVNPADFTAGQDASWGSIGNDPEFSATLTDARVNGTLPTSYWDNVATTVQDQGVTPSLLDRQSLQIAQPDQMMRAIDPMTTTPVTQGPDLAAPSVPSLDISRGILGGIAPAAETSPAINSMPDPMQSAAMGPYTAGNLTNSSAFGSVPAEVMGVTAQPAGVIDPAFSSNGLLSGSYPANSFQTSAPMPSYAELTQAAITPAQQTAMAAPNLDQAITSSISPGLLSTPAQYSIPTSYTPPTAAIAGPATADIAPAVQQQATQATQAAGYPAAPAPMSVTEKLGIPKGVIKGGLLGASVGGLPGALLGGILGNYMAKNGGFSGLLGSMNQPMSINNIGSGLSNTSSVYGGADRGTQANTSNGGMVTSLGDGRVAYTNSYGVTTVSNADGTGQAADWSGRDYGAKTGTSSTPSGAGLF